MVDTLGLPLAVWVTAADATDGEIGIDLLDHVKAAVPSLRKVWVDGAYAGLGEAVGQEIGVDVEVVRRPRGQCGFTPLPRRWVVERSFGWLNRYRRLSKDFEYWDENSASMVKIAFIHIMLRRVAF